MMVTILLTIIINDYNVNDWSYIVTPVNRLVHWDGSSKHVVEVFLLEPSYSPVIVARTTHQLFLSFDHVRFTTCRAAFPYADLR